MESPVDHVLRRDNIGVALYRCGQVSQFRPIARIHPSYSRAQVLLPSGIPRMLQSLRPESGRVKTTVERTGLKEIRTICIYQGSRGHDDELSGTQSFADDRIQTDLELGNRKMTVSSPESGLPYIQLANKLGRLVLKCPFGGQPRPKNKRKKRGNCNSLNMESELLRPAAAFAWPASERRPTHPGEPLCDFRRSWFSRSHQPSNKSLRVLPV